MTAYDNPHDFQVQYKKPDNLPWPEFSPKSVGSGWDWRIVLVFVTFWYGFTYHCLKFYLVSKIVKLENWKIGKLENWKIGMMEC